MSHWKGSAMKFLARVVLVLAGIAFACTFAFALMFLTAGPARAQTPVAPTCWAGSGAVGYTIGNNADGRYAGWWCPRQWSWSRVILVGKSSYALVHPVVPANATVATTAASYWQANVGLDCSKFDTGDAIINRLCDAAYVATDATKPPSRFIVSPYTGATYRATYATSKAIDGVRTTTSNGKVLITTAGQPTPCDCALGRVVEGATTY